jgi:LPXTG-motif cell wall-anchored protein
VTDIPKRVTGYLLLLFAFLLIALSLLPWAPITGIAGYKVLADDSGIRIISGEPDYVFTNMAPGDYTVIDLEIDNESNQFYSLAIGVAVEEGDGPLYEEFFIVIMGEEEKYSGPLSGLQEISLGSFSAGSTNSLQMLVSLPTDAGNDMQDMTVKISFDLYQIVSSGEETPGGKLPVTGTKISWLLPVGLILLVLGLMLLGLAKKEQQNK